MKKGLLINKYCNLEDICEYYSLKIKKKHYICYYLIRYYSFLII